MSLRSRITPCVLLLPLLLFSCKAQPQTPVQTTLFVYRFDPPAFVEFSPDFQAIDETPFTIPRDCGLLDVYPAPLGSYLLIELSCPTGQTVLLLDTDSESMSQPVTDSDSHFLAWSGDGRSIYLKVDSLGNARVVQVHPNGRQKDLGLTGWTYDLATSPASDDFIYTFSGGLGQGSELTLVQNKGRDLQQLYVDPLHYISFARFSPDGSRIALIKIPDSQTPFTVGELWLMNADGSDAHKLVDADAGHGYAANWSPDGSKLAFVMRENPEEESANQSPDSLISNIYLVDIQTGEVTQVTHFTEGRAETPHWSPDGNSLAFTVVLNGRMEVQIAEIKSGQIRSLMAESTCCSAWMRK